MPNYYNPYNFFPQTYPGLASMQQQPAVYNPPTQPPQTQMTQPKYWEWVEGEVGARAYQMPPGWPANQPIPLWDSTDTAIFLKSWNAMGIPNPIVRIPYASQDNWTQLGVSGSTQSAQYVTKEDFASLKEEIQSLKESFNNQNYRKNQNGSNNQNNQNNVSKGGNNNG